MKVLYLVFLAATALALKVPKGIKDIKVDKDCDCEPGYVKNAHGDCVKEEECPPEETCPDKNAVFEECHTACPPTCDNLDDKTVCTKQCVKGCICKKGYVLETKSGKCVKISDCPKPQCGKNEAYSTCGTACPKTCKNKDEKIVCNKSCVKGCFCKDGYVKNDAGDCIPEKDCPPKETCPDKNAVFEECHTACPPTCDNIDDKETVCTQQCVKGCICKKGYVLETKSGKCVKISDCPKPQCGKNEAYSTCGTACPKTCKNKDEKIVCNKSCVKGCFCKDGYVKNDAGDCIPEKDCPPKETCPDKNAVFEECHTACPPTCDTLDDKIVCTQQCVKGCICKKGYVLETKSGKCVKISDCPKPQCGKNEAYSTCGTACPRTCKNKDEKIVCNKSCVKGCFCKDGYVKNDAGDCIPEKDCDIHKCPKNEEYVDCVAGQCKPKHCADIGKSLPCPRVIPPCAGGCLCVEGYLRNEKGLCVPEKQCPSTIKCKANEVATDCLAKDSCGQKCSDKGKTVKCPPIPNDCHQPGCVCASGYCKNDKGICVPEDSCPPKETCPDKNAVFEECHTACPPTCDNIDDKTVCTKQCVKGCICKKGYVLETKSGKCVQISDCPKPQCGKNEAYSTRGTACPKTCKNKDEKIVCNKSCVKGCFCKDGYVKNDAGDCIPVKDCDIHKCPKNEEYMDCVAGQCKPKHCADIGKSLPCPRVIPPCAGGCLCVEGYLRNEKGLCVPEKQCPSTIKCKANEVATDCLVRDSCGQKCSDKGKKVNCPLIPSDCHQPGCVCASGYCKNDKGICVPEDSGPKGCNGDPKAEPGCGFCGQLCSQKNQKNVVCPASCPKNGCSCKKGCLYDDNLKKCVCAKDCSC